MKTRQPDPALELASRIYAHREEGESWTDAVDRYARDVLVRHPRTVHRWLSGESPVPAVVMDWLTMESEATPPELPRDDDSGGLPYPWCHDPGTCVGRGYCPRDPNCGE